jgi:hypothetical protein
MPVHPSVRIYNFFFLDKENGKVQILQNMLVLQGLQPSPQCHEMSGVSTLFFISPRRGDYAFLYLEKWVRDERRYFTAGT